MKISRYKPILKILSQYGPQSRSEFQKAFDITLSGSKRLIDVLLKREIVLRTGETYSSGGRPSELFDFNPEFAYLGAIEIGRAATFVALFDFCGHKIKGAEFPTDFDKTPDEVLNELSNKLLSWSNDLDKDRELYVSIATGGIVEKTNKTNIKYISFPSKNKKWLKFEPTKILKDKFKNIISIVPYADACLIAESRNGVLSGNTESSFLFHLGSDVVSSFRHFGHIHKSQYGMAGQIAHVPIYGNNLKCFCGNIGCAETLLSTYNIVEQLKKAYNVTENYSLGEIISLQTLIDGASKKNNICLGLLETIAQNVATLIGPAINLLGPSHVLFSGRLFTTNSSIGKQLQKLVTNALKDHAYPPNIQNTKFNISELGEDAIITGAALSARNRWINDNFVG